MKKSFEKKYSINVARLKPGPHEDRFLIESDFFEEFDHTEVDEGKVEAKLDMHKYETHLDVNFSLEGELILNCDRCMEPFPFPLHTTHRIIYSFDKELDFKGYEVMYVDHLEPQLSLVQEFFDFITLAVPLRKVPDPEVHLCDPKVLRILGLDAQGKPIASPQEEEKEMDPRWEALKKLKNPDQ
jgi:uncharacterized protein